MKSTLWLFVALAAVLTGCRNQTASDVTRFRLAMRWPDSQVFPTFGPVRNLDVVEIAGRSNGEITLLVTLQGLVNRTQPRIWVLENSERKRFWLDQLGATTTGVAGPLPLITKYRNEIAGIVVYDGAQPDTVNVATTIAGVESAIVAPPELVTVLTAAPYSLPVVADLRTNHFTGKLDAYRYELAQYGSRATHRLVIGLDPTKHVGSLRDYAVATGALTFWLDANNLEELALLDQFLRMLPPMSSYMGWWPNEPAGVSAASRHGVPVYAADWSTNLTVFGGVPRIAGPPAAPRAPPLEKKAYVAIFMSDGDNLQEDQHLVPVKWADPNRGKVPIGWTLNPALVDVAPTILGYFRRTATDRDVLVSGPSGLGYTYPDFWPAGMFSLYTRTSRPYLEAAGMRVITVWNNAPTVSDATAQAFSRDIPAVLGLTIQDESTPLRLIDGRLPIVRLAPSYARSEAELEQGIDAALQGWNHSAPLFIAVQGDMNQAAITPTAFFNVQQHYAGRPDVVFVRPDHFFELAGLANRSGLHQFVEGDFDGDGRTDLAFYYSGDDNWWVGLSQGNTLDWHLAGNTRGFGNLLDSSRKLFTGDFNGDGKTDLLFYFNGDGNWWMGLSDGYTFAWRLAANTAGFGNLLDAGHRIFTGDFNGDGKADLLFHYNGDGRWWLGRSDGHAFAWQEASNTAGFGNLLDAGHRLFTGDFNGDGRTDLLFYYNGDGSWWMGLFGNHTFNWRQAGTIRGFGNLLDAGHQIVQGDFNGDRKADIAFYYRGDGNWWMGLSDGNVFNWRGAGNVSGFGDLMDTGHRIWTGDFDGDRKTDIAFYYKGDGNWWMGLSDGSAFRWHGAGSAAGFGDLLDSGHRLFTGDYNGDRKTDPLFFYKGDGNWWMGVSDGRVFAWRSAGNTRGFGDLTH
jgi:hypothetical protein